MNRLIYLFLALLIVSCGSDDGGNAETALLTVSDGNQEVKLNTILGIYEQDCYDLSTGQSIVNAPRLEGFDEEDFDGYIDFTFNQEAYPMTSGTYLKTDFCTSDPNELDLVFPELYLFGDGDIFFEESGGYEINSGTLIISNITEDKITLSFEGVFDFYNLLGNYLGTVNCTFDSNNTNYEDFYN